MTNRPNIILITADNQPATLLGCYGNEDVYTPHTDKLAAGGVRYANAFSTNGMCSPGRASIFTGLMPSAHGIHNWLDDRYLKVWPEDWCAVREFRTLASALSANDYQTALVGKYHLGNPRTPMPGFDRWLAFGVGHTTSFYENMVVDDGVEKEVNDRHIVDFFTEKAVDYLAEVDASTPFFLNVNYDAPYLLPPANYGPDPRNPYYARFEGKDFPSFPRTAISDELLARVDGPDDPDNFYLHHLYGYLRMHNDPATMANICAQISLVDEGIGRLMEALEARGLTEDTLVIVTADQSNLYGQHGLWGHTMDTNPSHLYDAGLHIPLIFSQPGSLKAGTVHEELTSQYDFAQTILDYVGLGDLEFANSPGHSFAEALRTGVSDPGRGAVFFEQEESRGIRTPEYSYWKRLPGTGDAELFDLTRDPEQNTDVSKDPAYAEVIASLDEQLDTFFAEYSDPRYDLWTGGRPKGSVRRTDLYQELYGPDWAPVTDETETFEELSPTH
ncbi:MULTISPECIES: sulfatase-like hydrolase/transferase [Brevibacterium]|uniref:Sulfatase-like hydrolase/transferase n=1 Tax=Brevibacterium casei TaxID=33889 RepID=A0A7T4DKG4_9MICO|nr:MULTISPECIES: sulfatase-like hydrolase/transferase [Brevibacterium]QQB15411.1 sulfatase-like hydrolase/transferase [Brevibacterium casei]